MTLAALLLMIPAVPDQAPPSIMSAPMPASGLRETVSSTDGSWTAMVFSSAQGDDSLWLESGSSGEMKCLLGRACGTPDAGQWSIASVVFSGDAARIAMTARSNPSAPLRRYSVDPASGRITQLSELTAADVQAP